MKTTAITLFVALGLISFFDVSAQDAFLGSRPEIVWSSSPGLNIPESSHFNPADQIIYVSNIVGDSNKKDGLGFISKLNVKGKFIDKEWVKGLNAPKGIACTKTKLYVADLDRVIEIDLKTGKKTNTYSNPKSRSLNDVAVAANGRVFVTDSEGNCIFYVGKDTLEVFMENKQLSGMNGISANGDFIYLGSQGDFISINQKTKAIKILVKKVGYLDGIEQISPTVFVSSDWKGTIQLIRIGQGVEKILTTAAQKMNAADLGYIPALKLLLVPTFFDNRVVAYKLKL